MKPCVTFITFLFLRSLTHSLRLCVLGLEKLIELLLSVGQQMTAQRQAGINYVKALFIFIDISSHGMFYNIDILYCLFTALFVRGSNIIKHCTSKWTAFRHACIQL